MFIPYDKMEYDKLLKDSKAVISGGATGLGREVALLYANQGADVAIVDDDTDKGMAVEKELKAINSNCIFVKADITSSEEVTKASKKILATFGYVNVLVLNSEFITKKKLHESSDDDLSFAIDRKLNSAVYFTRAFIKSMMDRVDGTIAAVINDYASYGASNVSLMGAANGGVLSFMRNIGVEYSKYDIRANCVVMGHNIGVNGELIKEELGEKEAELIFTNDQLIRRRGTYRDVANACLYLNSQMSRFLTGEVIPVNGGSQAIAHKQNFAKHYEKAMERIAKDFSNWTKVN